MQVSSATAATSSNSTSTSTSTSSTTDTPTVDYNSFLLLLVQEMKNQDPTNPTDPTQYMSQLASFSNVEQAVKTNDKLSTMLTTTALTQAEGSIGRTVTSADGTQTGTVKAVTLGTDGTPVALLSDGSQMTLDGTVFVSGS